MSRALAAASLPVCALTPEMSWRPNSCWIRAACGSADAGVAIPRCALAWTDAVAGEASVALRCTPANRS
ncbi:MAG TPA: hypothetical protein VFP84_18150 [Kofleriaceae bacterium]|nr:hypothetical protein [Kofleriaceae bacterium]